MRKVTGGVLALAGTLLGFSGADATPPAGTPVHNQAAAREIPKDPLYPGWILSNRVAVVVDPVEALDLLGDHHDSAAAGATVAFLHRVQNLGNGDAWITVAARNRDGDDFDFEDLTIRWPAEPAGSAAPLLGDDGVALPILLAPGETADFTVGARVPAGRPEGDSGALEVSAISASGAVVRTREDRVTVVNEAVLEIRKTASPATARPGDVVTFTIEGRNLGTGPARGVPITLNGEPAAAVLIQDVFPHRTRLEAIQPPPGATPVYHLAGTDSLAFTSTPPADLAAVDRAGVLLPEVPVAGAFRIELKLRLETDAYCVIENVAEAAYDACLDMPSRAESNVATVTLPVPEPVIAFFADGGFRSETRAGELGDAVFVQAVAPGCDADPGRVDEAVIVVSSRLTGDRESYLARETGPSTGVFRIPGTVLTHDAAAKPAKENNGVVEALMRDVLEAVITACPPHGPASADLYLEPYGIAFDTGTGRLIEGAVITLVDAFTGEPAQVFESDGVTPAPHIVVTDAGGRYRFAMVAPGTCLILVDPPPGCVFPSILPPDAHAGRLIDAEASYGKVFEHDEFSPVWVDLPMDPAPLAGILVVEKAAVPDVAEVGDFVDYTVTVHNEGDGPAGGVTVTDRLPPGFVYREGSARVDGVPIADPAGEGGPVLVFAVGEVPAGEAIALTYRLGLGAGSWSSDGVNRAFAASGPDTSNTASARVRVERGVFSERGYVLGRVVMLPAGDGAPRGIPGVRVFLEDGTFSVTDGDGQYSFYDVAPRTHVLKVDPHTLPPGTRLVPLTVRHAGAGGTAFVDLKNGELNRTDFAAVHDPVVETAIRARRAAAGLQESELDDALDAELRPDAADHAPRDERALPASGLIDAGGDIRRPAAPVGEGLTDRTAHLPEPPVTPVAPALLESLVVGADAEPRFLNLADGQTLPAPWTVVQVKGAAGSALSLTLNGRAVPGSRVGKRVTDAARGVEAAEYVGIELAPGDNVLTLTQTDGFGNPRGSRSIRVAAPGSLAVLRLDPEYVEAPADGVTTVRFLLSLADRAGLPVTARIPVTLDSEVGTWDETDLDPGEPGVQVFVEGGRAVYLLRAPVDPGDGTVRAASGLLGDEAYVSFVPELRPIMGVGLVEGTVALRDFSLGELVETRPQDDFEDVLRDVAWTSDDGETRADARAALYLKGKVKGSYLLTLAYDSEQDEGARLFRDIRPDAFYPVYGSSDQRGFDARSLSRLYLRVDKGRSYLLYGDFVTDPVNERQNLGAYRRSLTGAQEQYRSERVAVNAFVTHDDSRQVVEELEALGISGPYLLRRHDVVPNSETVEILVRDRNQPDVILAVESRTRFTDYVLDPWTGEILFRAPVPGLDPRLNPVSIRVTYESADGGEKYWVGGVTAAARVVPGLEAGASWVRDENPAEDRTLVSGNLTGRLGERSSLTAEIARSEDAQGREGGAGRLEWRHAAARVDARVFGARTDAGFDNPSASFSPGRTEAGGKAVVRVSPGTRLQGEAIYTEDRVGGGRRQGAYLSVEQRVANGVEVEVGARRSEDDLAAAADSASAALDYTTLRGKVTAQVPHLPRLSLSGAYEQELSDADRRSAWVSAEYQVQNRTRLYLRHEFITSLTGPYSLNGSRRHTTVVGVDSDYMRDGHVFSEYRARDAFHGRDAEAAIGLRNQWLLARGLWLHTHVERVHSLAHDLDRESMVVGGAVEVLRDPGLKATARFEYRNARSTDNYLNTLGLARRLSRDWTLLARNVLSVDDAPPEVGDRFRDRFQIGAAWRDLRAHRWSLLARYEFRYEDHEAAARVVRDHTASLHVHVRPDSAWTWTNLVAAKLADDAGALIASRQLMHLYSTRVHRDFAARWDAGVLASLLWSRGYSALRYGLGAELGRMVADDLWLAVGYNVFGFDDDDLVSDGYTQRGPYLRLRWKFDECILPGSRGGGGEAP